MASSKKKLKKLEARIADLEAQIETMADVLLFDVDTNLREFESKLEEQVFDTDKIFLMLDGLQRHVDRLMEDKVGPIGGDKAREEWLKRNPGVEEGTPKPKPTAPKFEGVYKPNIFSTAELEKNLQKAQETIAAGFTGAQTIAKLFVQQKPTKDQIPDEG